MHSRSPLRALRVLSVLGIKRQRKCKYDFLYVPPASDRRASYLEKLYAMPCLQPCGALAVLLLLSPARAGDSYPHRSGMRSTSS